MISRAGHGAGDGAQAGDGGHGEARDGAGEDPELLELWARWCRARERAERTRSSYRFALARLARAGIARVSDVSRERLAAWVQARSEQATAQTVRQDVLALTSVLSVWVEAGRARRSWLRALRQTAPRGRRRRPLHARHLSRAELAALVHGARTRGGVWGPRADEKRERTAFLVSLAALSGLRASELSRLRWEEIDRERRALQVLGATKTGAERLVPISSELAAVLDAHAAELAARGEALRGYLFRHGSAARKNVHATHKTLWLELRLARRAAPGLEWVDFHALRHTRASWWIQAGVPVAKVALWLGHSVDVCLRHYAGLLQGYDPDCERGGAAA